MSLPSISIVVVCYNEEENITACLKSLLAQNYPQNRYEIVVVDNDSTDRTQELIKTLQKKTKRLRLFVNPIINIAKSRNIGLKEARHPYIAFIDADCLAPPDWLTTLVEAILAYRQSDSQIIAVGGANIPPPQANFFQKTVGLARSSFLIHHGSVQGKTYHQKTPVNHLPTVNLLYLKRPLIKIGGFDESFADIAEDLELSWRLKNQGYQFIYLPQSFVWHQLDRNLFSFLKKVFRYGKGRVWFFKKHPRAFNLLFLLPISLLVFWFFFFLQILNFLKLDFLLIFYLYLLIIVSILISLKKKSLTFSPLLFFIFLLSHPAYALGELYGLLPHRKRKITAVGVVILYKCGNLGDATIFETTSEIMAKELHLNELSILAVSPRGFLAKTVKLPLKQKEKLIRELFDPSLRPKRGQLFSWLRCFWKINPLIFWGGYWLHDYTWYNLPLILGLTLLAKILGKRVVFLGIGAGLINRGWSKPLARLGLNKIDYLSVRDEFSLKSLTQAGVQRIHLSADPVLLKKRKSRKAKPRKRKLIGLNIAAWFDIKHRWQFPRFDLEPQIAKVADLIEKIIESPDSQIVFLPSMFPEDAQIMKKIFQKVKKKKQIRLPFLKMPSVQDYLQAINQLDLLIAMRLHPLIFAHLQGIPKIALSYAPKVNAFMKAINEEKALFSLDKLNEKKLLKLVIQQSKKPRSPRNNLINISKSWRSLIDLFNFFLS